MHHKRQCHTGDKRGQIVLHKIAGDRRQKSAFTDRIHRFAQEPERDQDQRNSHRNPPGLFQRWTLRFQK